MCVYINIYKTPLLPGPPIHSSSGLQSAPKKKAEQMCQQQKLSLSPSLQNPFLPRPALYIYISTCASKFLGRCGEMRPAERQEKSKKIDILKSQLDT